jgi:hypothetical protein
VTIFMIWLDELLVLEPSQGRHGAVSLGYITWIVLRMEDLL